MAEKDHNENYVIFTIPVFDSNFSKETELNFKLELGENENKSQESLPCKVKKKTIWRQYGGIGLALSASVFFSSILVLAKMIQESGFEASEATVVRYIGVFIPSIPLVLFFECGGQKILPTKKSHQKKTAGGEESQKKSKSIFDTVWPLDDRERRNNAIGLLLRGIFSAGAVLLRFSALNYITTGDTAVISFGSPILVTILAHFILKEKTGIVSILTSIATLVGVIIISRPPFLTGEEGFDTQVLIGTGMAFGSMVCTAFGTIIGRKVRAVQFSLQLLAFGGIGLTQSLAIAMVITKGRIEYPTNWHDTFLMLGIASLAFFAQLSMVLALKLETAGVVSLVRSCDVIIGFILQFIIFSIAPDLYSYLGATIILGGVLLTAFRKYMAGLPKDGTSKLRNIFGFLI